MPETEHTDIANQYNVNYYKEMHIYGTKIIDTFQENA